MKNVVYLFGPTIMIFIGLSYFESIPITFVLFYGWLFFIPFITYLRHSKLKEAFVQSIKNGFAVKPILIGMISGVICLLSIYGSVALLQNHLFDIDRLSKILIQWGFSGTSVWGFILVLILINPMLEEWYWREFMFKRYLDKIGVPKSVILTSFFYALYHMLSLIPLFEMPFSLIATIPVFFAGLLWGYFRVKFSSIIAPVISHALADIGIILVYLNYLM
ncbi:CPBP family intramembrane glutamic endopeptidase [Paenisporosarcina sp. OV554]|uniref:CPBP family intramembrane glutamic endopeptidase n=1 Tax=Paenisporosarcina sp. OV554 TaxID=2135694 RepID=UPI000D3DB9FA|nr:type II CAAX endopeptidase family protein [Paenisporosarcina sp. OV554]PUB15984.1 hypothetical protein C8K15_103199 [Paenisporosarcina sp. OV554]